MNRKLKIGYKSKSNALRRYSKLFPSLTLSGNWLHEAGFEIGQDVRLQIEKNKIIISC